MKRDKYMGMDVHQATTVVAVIDAEGKIVLETIVATAAAPIRRLIESISGPRTFSSEETGGMAQPDGGSECPFINRQGVQTEEPGDGLGEGKGEPG